MMLYPGYVPLRDIDPHILHYGLQFSVGSWRFDKADWHDEDMTNVCWKFFPDPPNPSSLVFADVDELRKDTISIECVRMLNNALYLHHKRRGCPDPTVITTSSETQYHNVLEHVNISINESDAQRIDNINKKDAGSIGEAMKGNEEQGRTGESIWSKKADFRGRKGEPVIRLDVKAALRKLANSSKGENGVSIIGKAYWMVALLWSLLVFFFLVIVYAVYSSNGQKQRSTKIKSRRRFERIAVNIGVGDK